MSWPPLHGIHARTRGQTGQPRRRLGTAGLAAMILCASMPITARAADDSSKPMPPSWYFSGLYLGMSGGTFNPSLNARFGGQSLKIRVGDGEFALHLGYGVRLGARTVVGIEYDGALTAGVSPTQAADVPDEALDAFRSLALDGTTSLNIRLGRAFNEHVFGYVRAGGAIYQLDGRDFVGGRFGAGVELRLWKGLGLRAEVIRDEYGRKTLSNGLSLRPTATSLRGGIYYRF